MLTKILEKLLKCRRGSAAMLTLAIMAFAVIGGAGVISMLSQSNKQAKSDLEEQMAWYAAEAGYVRARTELLAVGSDWKWLGADIALDESNNIKSSYRVDISRKTVTTGTGGAQTTTYTPIGENETIAAGDTFVVIARGTANGTKKAIRREVTPSSGTSGGGGGDGKPEDKPTETYNYTTPLSKPDALFVTSGKVTVSGQGGNTDINIIGDVYSSHSSNIEQQSNLTGSSHGLPETFATVIPDRVFHSDYWTTPDQYTDSVVIKTSSYTGGVAEGPAVAESNQKITTLVVDGDCTINSGTIKGNVCIIADGDVNINIPVGTDGKKSYLMILANGNVTMNASVNTNSSVMISSHQNAILAPDCAYFDGQIQAKGINNGHGVEVNGKKKTTKTVKFENIVLNNFGLNYINEKQLLVEE